jgi:hypothetical protein
MNRLFRLFPIILTLMLSISPVLASDDDRADHFEGEPSRTLAEAIENFREANARLEQLIAQENPDTQVVFEIHQLTYTLENALDKIEDEVEDLADVLEEVHLASERNDGPTVQERAREYLDTAHIIIR